VPLAASVLGAEALVGFLATPRARGTILAKETLLPSVLCTSYNSPAQHTSVMWVSGPKTAISTPSVSPRRRIALRPSW
jgi:predicted membrane-bound mannosyltransferase